MRWRIVLLPIAASVALGAGLAWYSRPEPRRGPLPEAAGAESPAERFAPPAPASSDPRAVRETRPPWSGPPDQPGPTEAALDDAPRLPEATATQARRAPVQPRQQARQQAPLEAGAGAVAALLCHDRGASCLSGADCCAGLACVGGVAGYGTRGRCDLPR